METCHKSLAHDAENQIGARAVMTLNLKFAEDITTPRHPREPNVDSVALIILSTTWWQSIAVTWRSVCSNFRQTPKASIYTKSKFAKLDEVYSFLLYSSLFQKNIEKLNRTRLVWRRRALPLAGYKTLSTWGTPRECEAVFKSRLASFLQRVPGFYFKRKRSVTRCAWNLIPVRNAFGVIVGLRVRLDQINMNQNISGFIHQQNTYDGVDLERSFMCQFIRIFPGDTVRVTEGELKRHCIKEDRCPYDLCTRRNHLGTLQTLQV